MKKTPHTLAEFEKKFEASAAGQERISQLKKQVAHLAGPGSVRSVSIPCDDEITLGLVSCSHFGSLYSDASDLNYFYDHEIFLLSLHIDEIFEVILIYTIKFYKLYPGLTAIRISL